MGPRGALSATCMRVTRRGPVSVLNETGEQRFIKVLISEMNPPICELVRELAKGGSRGSVSISFASKETLARVCPPPVCSCKPCVCLTERQKWLKRIALLAKITFLSGTIIGAWYVGALGSTWGTWNLTDCLIRLYYDLVENTIFVYDNKCKGGKDKKEEEKEENKCLSTESAWNRRVITCYKNLVCFYYTSKAYIRAILYYNPCPDKKDDKKQAEAKKEPPKKDTKKAAKAKSKFVKGEAKPCEVTCECRDYYKELSHIMYEDALAKGKFRCPDIPIVEESSDTQPSTSTSTQDNISKTSKILKDSLSDLIKCN